MTSPQTTRAEVRQNKMLIGGEFCSSASGKTFPTINPVDEQVISEIAEGDEEDINRAVGAARRAFDDGPWTKMDARERARILFRWADLIETHMEELGHLESLDTGKPLTESLGYDIPSAAKVIRYFAGWADKMHGKTIQMPSPFFSYTMREPVGVCGQIIPWNFPLAMASWKLGPALAAGCTTVLKPAEQTPLTALRAAELALEAGLPEGVLNVVPGYGPTAGAALVRHPDVDKIAFTGERATATTIKREAAPSMKRLSFELGGKNPNIIFDDADLEQAVEGAYGAIFLNVGQNCCAGSRAFVHEKIYDEFVERLSEKANKSRLGDPFSGEADHGPLIDKAQFKKVMGYVQAGQKEGAVCTAGGKREFDRGYFVRPTVFKNVEDKMSIATDEIFGPVVSVLRFSELDEVVRRANDTEYGLAAAVYTRDIGRAHAVADRVRAGTVWVNCYNIVDTAAPFGGFKASGNGRELGEMALDAYTENKTVTILRDT